MISSNGEHMGEEKGLLYRPHRPCPTSEGLEYKRKKELQVRLDKATAERTARTPTQ